MADKEEEGKQLDSVTDTVQENEVLDESRALGALSGLSSSKGTSDDASSKTAISVKQEDVDIIVAELEVTEDEAAAALREAAAEEGNDNIEGQQLVAAALRRLVVS